MVVSVYKKNRSIVFLRNLLLSWMKKNNKSVITKEQIEKVLKIASLEEKQRLKNTLYYMEKRKELLLIRKLTYILINKKNILKGTVEGHRNGYGFFNNSHLKESCWLSKKQMKNCIHGDLISAYVFKMPDKKKYEAVVIKVNTVHSSFITGKCFKRNNKFLVFPYDLRFNFQILIVDKNKKKSVKSGFIVIVKLIKRATKNKIATGIVYKLLGKTMTALLAAQIALHNYFIPKKFSKDVQREIINLDDNFPDDVINNYVDLRSLPLVTIDDEEAFDFDDAICCRSNQDGTWNVWIAISDVSYYVKPNSLLDEEAKNRSTSVYFPSYVVSMLPKNLSDNLCSLIPKKDRLSLVCEIILSVKGDILNYKHYQAIINSHARLTYTELYNIWKNKKSVCIKYNKLLTDLHCLYQLYLVLKSSPVLKNKISFKKKEYKIKLSSSLKIKDIYKKNIYNSHELIELCMVLANLVTAQFLIKNESFVPFRNHEPPDAKSIRNCQEILHGLGFYLNKDIVPCTIDYSAILKQLFTHSHYEIVQELLLRSMKSAVYNVNNKGHFALSLRCYTHFTSPIRRYPDLLVHRVLKYEILKRKNKRKCFINKNALFYKDKINKIANYCSFAERRAECAVRDAIEWLKCDFIKKKLGEEFEGTIFHVVEFGFFVRLSRFLIDGLVHISTLGDNKYFYDNQKQKLVGKSSDSFFSLGDKVIVKIHTVSTESRKIEFLFLSKKIFLKKNKFFINL
ncbi:ribonuclease R [Buchnera aphidicola]|uniref:Ribonuclease R n=1 Tax=Buchnera aphidicola (Anoecia oenotherae) TaxID=1241833 RepID=A0A4D6XYI8_9GAMM|nr:ribonuclease R [Buchnera aphidicola]QCI19554.1 ribonuclease R [Buchnera aphidicola (Anoecia oenotherae)]